MEVGGGKVGYLADKPITDVWLQEYYPPQIENFEKIISSFQKLADPAMLNTLENHVYAKMHINAYTKKLVNFKTVYIHLCSYFNKVVKVDDWKERILVFKSESKYQIFVISAT